MSETEQQIRGNEETQTTGIEPAAANPGSESSAEIERLRMENETLTNSIRMREARELITKIFTDAGARSPGLLFDVASEKLQFSSDGQLLNAAAIAENLKKTFPEQFGFDKTPDSIGGGAGTGRPVQFLTAETLSGMTPAQIKDLDWQEVKQVLGAGD
ncbi:MAG: hypothetical protein ACR2M8_08070 [Pyrinomonadaceae bacterium]|nr:hypothetical protein [Blastocatellia bacterium]